MAAASLATIGPDVVEAVAQPITLAEILQADNLTDLLTDAELGKIGSNVIRDFEIDDKSRADWLKIYDQSLDIAMQVRKEKVFPWPNASNIKFPLLTVASIQFQARAYPAIVDGANLVKGRVLGPDPDGMKRARADRIGQHMTWQLLYKMKGWEEATDRLLLMLPIVGCVFRKSYFDPISGTNCSDMIPASDFVVHYLTKSLDSAPRYTHILHLYPYEVRERIAAGLWRDIHFDQAPENSEDEDGQVDFYEQHRMLDLDGDGIPEQYVVTTTTEGQVARIVPCFDEGDVFVRSPDGGVIKATDLDAETLQSGFDIQIVRVERQQYFTKYGFIPAPDGSFYDIGFGSLLYDISWSIDTTINQLLDAGALQNIGGGFIGAGVNLKGGMKPFQLGEWKRIDVGNGNLKDNVLPLPAPGPSDVLFKMLGMLIEAAKEITSVQDVLTGAPQGQNTPATTVLAQIEQGQKVMTAIFKRIHRAFGGELRILRRLNRDHLDEEEYFQLNDEDKAETQPGPDGQQAGMPQPTQPGGQMSIGRRDYQDDDLDVVPVSDPTMVSDALKMARAQALMAFNGDPLTNQLELRQRYFGAIGEPDIKKLLDVPKAPPDPKVLETGAKLAIEHKKADNATLAARSAAADTLADAATKLSALGLTQDAAILAGIATQLGSETEDDGQQHAAGPGPVPGMEGQPADAGVPSVPPGPAGGTDDQMGGGAPDGAGESGVGGPARPTGGPVA